jgi:hypothetical protein
MTCLEVEDYDDPRDSNKISNITFVVGKVDYDNNSEKDLL